MRYYCAALIALAVIFIQPAYSQSAPGVVILLYPPVDCEIDFDRDFWSEYDSAMAREWNIPSQTICLDGLGDQDKADLLAALQRAGLNVIVMQDDSTIVRGINDRANGVAQPALNFGAVEFNYHESAKVLSHETLHLMLEEAGHPRSCYVDAVHDNAHRFARYGDVVILAHFDC